ncbi:MAG: DNA recombination protein RmuC [Urechidicola sp.]|nr:DNA recombination protein RmuC [Urechidicola sp.]
MNAYLISILIAILFLAIGFFIGKLISKLRHENTTSTLKAQSESQKSTLINKEQLIVRLEEDIELLRKENQNVTIDLTRKVSELENSKLKLEENKKEVENIQEKFTKEFKVLANEILESNSTKITKQNKENLEAILNPLQKNIEKFEKKVEDTNKESLERHSALRQQIVGLKELNLQMSKEAVNLTKALKGDSKIQGDWGETQLEVLLEKANLTKEVHYTTQGGYRDDDGKLKKPDFIINLPDNRHLIIDAKVSLTNYENYFSEENEIEKEKHLKKHIESIRKHFKGLGEKKYADLYEINSPDYVLMFLPIEPALMLALHESKNLYLEALDKNVVLVSTSTLLATLSTVSSMWRQENQKKNVLEIAEQAGRLYDQFVNLTDDFIKVGNQLKTVQGSYDSSMKKLTGKGNLIRKVERIRELGAKTNKNINKNLLDRADEKE